MKTTPRMHERYDLIIVGGGPAGITAAINAESEGINTLVLDGAEQFGGQAGTSSKIENYSGFPKGVSGQRLTSLMIEQALGFETEFLAPWRVEEIELNEQGFAVRHDNESILADTVLVATGVQPRALVVPNLAAHLGRGVKYGSPDPEKEFKGSKKLYVVGGANSAGQAAMHLSKFTDCRVGLLIRGESIHDKMSSYLADRIVETDNIEVHTNTEVVGVDGDGRLKKLILKTGKDQYEVPADELFIFIGANPKTMWLPERVIRDSRGFIITGGDISDDVRGSFATLCERQPFAHETSIPGLFAAGDVRSGTIKRVSSAAGDGAVVTPELHRYFGNPDFHCPQGRK